MPTKIVAVLIPGGKVAETKPQFLLSTERVLGLREYLKDKDAELYTTSDKDGPNCELEKYIPEMQILITTPFHPDMTRERIEKARNLKLIITAGVGSDHIDLHAAADKKITVVECTGSNTSSVAEDEAMRIAILLRNFMEGYKQAVNKEWNVAEVVSEAYDVKAKTVGTLGAGHIAQDVMKRLQGWEVRRLYSSRHRREAMDQQGVEFVQDFDKFLAECDVITINVPLTDKTRGMFNKETIGKMKKGAYLVNNARGAICDTDAVVEALESGQLRGYGGDVWPKQPAPPDHPWRFMPRHAMTPHDSGATIDAQKRIAGMTKEILDAWFDQKPLPKDYTILDAAGLNAEYA